MKPGRTATRCRCAAGASRTSSAAPGRDSQIRCPATFLSASRSTGPSCPSRSEEVDEVPDDEQHEDPRTHRSRGPASLTHPRWPQHRPHQHRYGQAQIRHEGDRVEGEDRTVLVVEPRKVTRAHRTKDGARAPVAAQCPPVEQVEEREARRPPQQGCPEREDRLRAAGRRCGSFPAGSPSRRSTPPVARGPASSTGWTRAVRGVQPHVELVDPVLVVPQAPQGGRYPRPQATPVIRPVPPVPLVGQEPAGPRHQIRDEGDRHDGRHRPAEILRSTDRYGRRAPATRREPTSHSTVMTMKNART